MTMAKAPRQQPSRTGQRRFPAIGTTAVVVVTDPAAAGTAERMLRADLDELDRVCSRFRADSEIRRLQFDAGSAVVVGPLLADVLDTALRAAAVTGGLVDPTVGRAMAAIGYDRDLAAMALDGPGVEPEPAPGWWRITWDPRRRQVLVPRGVVLDVGATGKALATDLAAARLATSLGCGVLVSVGGDIAVAGPPPAGGWRVHVDDDHTRPGPDGQQVLIGSGGLATSGTCRRRWIRGGAVMHHVLDPTTGRPARGWRTVSVAAATCTDANTASTAAMVLGTAAPNWLAARGLPARLVDDNGGIRAVAGWPDPYSVPARGDG